MMQKINLLLIVLMIPLFMMCEPENQVLFEDKFSYPDGELPDIFWLEGSEKVKVINERLYVDANPDRNGESYPVSTVWLNKIFTGDIQVEFDTHVLSSPDKEHNINFFFLYSDPSGKPLKESRHNRKTGDYKKYHELNGYIFTYLANGRPDTARFRFRDNPGFNLVKEINSYECKRGKTYHFEIRKKGNHIQYLVDGQVFLDKKDKDYNDIHQEGLIGFRTWRTELWFDNLVIKKL
jgi:hypothetical protein